MRQGGENVIFKEAMERSERYYGLKPVTRSRKTYGQGSERVLNEILLQNKLIDADVCFVGRITRLCMGLECSYKFGPRCP